MMFPKMGDFQRENDRFSLKCGILDEKTCDFRFNGGFSKRKARDFRLNGGFSKMKDRKSTRLNSSHFTQSRMPSSA